MGSFDDYHVLYVFATESKEKAEAYVEKFNRIIPKAKEYYNRLYDDLNIEDEQFDRYFKYYDTNEAFIQEIEVR